MLRDGFRQGITFNRGEFSFVKSKLFRDGGDTQEEIEKTKKITNKSSKV